MWQTVSSWIAPGGIAGLVGLVVWVAYRLHMDAVLAERRRADDWRDAYEQQSDALRAKEDQVARLLGRHLDDGSDL